MPTVQQIDRSKLPEIFKPAKQMRKNWKVMNREVPSRETELVSEIQILQRKQTALKAEIKAKNKELQALRNHVVYGNQPVSLYVLRLQDNCWYIGMTYNVEKRFKQHSKGKGAQWTKLHKPIEIVETRKTKFLLQDEAARLEDDLTLEYALKYGGEKVRGGGFCQVRKPRWPSLILENDGVRFYH